MSEQKSKFSRGQEVFINAYLPKRKNEFFMCRGKIESVPGENKKFYKIRINAVADRPVGGPPCDEQATLLGRTVSKKHEELHRELSPFFKPGGWIEVVTS